MGFTFLETQMQIERHGTTRRYSDSVVHNGTVYLVEVPSNPEGRHRRPDCQSAGQRRYPVGPGGKRQAQVAMVTVYLADMADYDGMNAVWDAWVPDGHAPTRACVQARLANPAWRWKWRLPPPDERGGTARHAPGADRR
jgi:enamine deaminase RidA (YjgF/YER057c/UK114 family)